MKGRKLVLRHFKLYFFYYVIAVMGLAGANVLFALTPGIIGRFADGLKDGLIDRQAIVSASLELFGIGVGYGVLFGTGQYLSHRLGRKFEFNVRKKLFRHFTSLSEFYYSNNGVGKLLSYVMNDVTSVRESIANGVNQMTNASVLLISCLVMMAVSDIPLHLAFFCALPLVSIPFLVIYFGPRIKSRSRQVQESLAAMTESAEEQFGGIRVTKTFAVENIARSRFGETVDTIRDNQLKLVRMTSSFQAMIPFAGALSLIVAIIYGGFLTINLELSIGNFVALTLYLRLIMNPLQQIGQVINTMQRSRASIDRLNRLLEEKPDIREIEFPLPINPEQVELDVRGLSFKYPGAGRAALEQIEFQVKHGQTLGIVGRTGSGKSTLVKLLLRVYDPPRGAIKIGGQDILDLTLESLRTQIAYVPQEGFLFSTTIRDNISFFDREAPLELVEHAAKLADIYENIMDFPESFDTKLGERGLTLSGGQRQRASLARGIIKDAPILILDDSVSAVDAVTETNIIANMREVRKGKTTILIAHRISAVKHADMIIVMDDSRIVERGTHEELLKMNGFYASLHAIQEEGVTYG